MSKQRFLAVTTRAAATIGFCLALLLVLDKGRLPGAPKRTSPGPLAPTSPAPPPVDIPVHISPAAPPPHTVTACSIPDDTGAITEMIVHYVQSTQADVAPFFRDLFAKFPSSIAVKVLCADNEAVEDFIEQWGKRALLKGRSIDVINAGCPVSIWARDRRIARQYPDETVAPLFTPVVSPDYPEDMVGDLMLTPLMFRAGLAPRRCLSAFLLEGGNLVSGQYHNLFGINVLTNNSEIFTSVEEARDTLHDVFGREPILIQDTKGEVPWDHVDMYVTLLPGRRAFVADSADGLRRIEHQDDSSAVTLWNPGAGGLRVERNPDRERSFDDIARQLTDCGYEVTRLPALVDEEGGWMVTYNNVILDQRDGVTVVFMPSYRLPSLDQAAATIYEAHGFTVQTIDVSKIFVMGGAVRCLVNVTRRVREAPSVAYARFGPVGTLRRLELNPPVFRENVLAGPAPR